MPKDMTHEVVLNLGSAILTARVDEKTAGSVAASLGMEWPQPYVTRWPFLIRAIGQKGAIEAQALADALRPVVEIPDGEFVVWIVGRRGGLDGPPPQNKEGRDLEVLPLERALERARELCKDCTDFGWIVTAGGPGDVLAK